MWYSYLLHDIRKRSSAEPLNVRLLPTLELLRILDRSILRRDDRSRGVGGRGPSERDLRGEARAESAVAREREFCQGFEHGTLTAGLVTHDDQLRERDVLADVAREEAIDLIEEFPTNKTGAGAWICFFWLVVNEIIVAHVVIPAHLLVG